DAHGRAAEAAGGGRQRAHTAAGKAVASGRVHHPMPPLSRSRGGGDSAFPRAFVIGGTDPRIARGQYHLAIPTREPRAMSAASAKWSNPFYVLFVLWLVGAGLYILYAWMTYSGLYRWAAEWEMAQWGSYEVEGTLIGLFLALVGLPAGALALLGKLSGRPAA